MKIRIGTTEVKNPIARALIMLLLIPILLCVGLIVAVIFVILIPIILFICLIAVLMAAIGYSSTMPEMFEKTKRSFNRGRKAGKK